MAVKTMLEQLEEVQAAISNVMKGQDITIAGKRWTLADLEALNHREKFKGHPLFSPEKGSQGRDLMFLRDYPVRPVNKRCIPSG